MTVSAQTLAQQYLANGVTTTFPYQFRILLIDQLKVFVNGALQTSGFSVTGVGNQGGGNVVFSIAPASGSIVLIRRISDRVRTTDFQQAPYFTQEELLDFDQDYQTMLLQESADNALNAIRIPPTEAAGLELPTANIRANKAVIFDALGNVTVSQDDYNDQAANAAAIVASVAGDAANAAASAAAAASSAASAAASFDDFDDRYLGAKTTNPTLDNDGNPLLIGALYFNTTTQQMRVFSIAGWQDLTAVDRIGSQGAISGDRNRVINGSCQIVNVATFVATNGASGYGGPELFVAANIGAGGQFTQSQGSLSFGGLTLPTVRQTVNTANTNIGTTNFWSGIVHRIEGFNAFDLRGKPVTVSFVFNTNVSGNYSFAIRDNGNQSYVTTFTAMANVPQQVVIPLAAIPSAANIPNTNALGLEINIGLLNTGTFQTATINQWQTGNFFSATGATNWGATAGNFIELTNLQLEEGTVATPFIRRSIGVELALTQRYFEQIDSAHFIFSGSVTSGNLYYVGTIFNTKKRASPTVSLTNINQVGFPATGNVELASTSGFRESRTANATTAQGFFVSSWTASARL